MNDLMDNSLIKRQDAIEALKQQAKEMSRWSERYTEQRKGILTAINIVSDLPSTQPEQRGLNGWVCPVCGRGLSPFTSVCPCNNEKGWEISC